MPLASAVGCRAQVPDVYQHQSWPDALRSDWAKSGTRVQIVYCYLTTYVPQMLAMARLTSASAWPLRKTRPTWFLDMLLGFPRPLSCYSVRPPSSAHQISLKASPLRQACASLR